MNHSRASKTIFLSGLFFFLSFMLSGCSDPPRSPEMRDIDRQFYELIKQKDFEQATAMFAPEESPDEWMAYLKHNNEELGDLQSYELKDTVVNTILTGTVYISRYKTKYSKGEANEVLTVRDDTMKGVNIAMYKINPRQKKPQANTPAAPAVTPVP
ncbi:MAG: hypothetical protein HYX62_03190 [Gammaproteobacteria bacterium]|nr:hypothetical protein [Gammaproteobacteria bacterium]